MGEISHALGEISLAVFELHRFGVMRGPRGRGQRFEHELNNQQFVALHQGP